MSLAAAALTLAGSTAVATAVALLPFSSLAALRRFLNCAMIWSRDFTSSKSSSLDKAEMGFFFVEVLLVLLLGSVVASFATFFAVPGVTKAVGLSFSLSASVVVGDDMLSFDADY